MGVFYPNKAYYKYHMGYDLSDDQTDNIDYLREFVIKEIDPPSGGESMSKTLNTYGYTLCGICEGWNWYHKDTISDYTREKGYKPIEEATAEELWKIVALSERYWELFYKRINNNEY